MFSSPRGVFLWRYVLALVLVSTLTAGGLAGGSWYLDHKLTRAERIGVDLDQERPGPMNFLILGSDSRAFVADDEDRDSFGDTGVVGGQRADAILVAHVDPRSGGGVVVSFPRDLYVTHPGRSGRHRINEAFEAGPQRVIDVIRVNFDIPIHHYVELDFAGFRGMVNALGGVRMYIPAPVRDRKTGLDIPEPGCATLDGDQALAWVRSRQFSYFEAGRWRTDPTGDLGRIERQQEFMRRLMAQAIRKGALNPLRANRLADAALVNLTFDEDFSVRDALRLMQAFRPEGPDGVEMVTLPTRAAGAGLRATAEAEAVVARLRPAPPGSPDDVAVAPEQVRVRVLNGTGAAGLAGDTAAALAAVGFAPAGAADAGRFNYTRTEIRYAPASLAKARYLARYLRGAGTLVADSGLRNLDVVLVVGRDFQGVADRPGPAPEAPPAPAPAPPAETPPAAEEAPAPSAAPEPDC